MKTQFYPRAVCALAAVLLIGAAAQRLPADTYTWTGGGTSSNWSDGDNWGGTSPSFAAGDTADLSALNLSAVTTSVVDAPTTLGTLLIGDTDNTHAYTLNGSTLTLDNHGAGASVVQTAGSIASTLNTSLFLAEDTTIGNASASQFNVFGGVNGTDAALWFESTGGGIIRLQHVGIGSGIKEIYQNGNGEVRLATAIAMDGDLKFVITANGTVKVHTEQAPIGTGDLYLVNDALTGGNYYIGGVNNTGSIYHSGTSVVGDQINGSVGANVVSIIQQSATSQLDVRGGTFNLNTSGVSSLVNTGGKALNLKQTTVGTGTLVLRNNTATGSGVSTDEGTLAHTGDVVSDGTGAGATLIKSHIGTGITNITQNSSTSQLNLYDKTLNVNPDGIALVNNGGARIDIKDDVAGTGDLILMNNSSVADAVYFKEKVMNHTGRVINSGTGTGRSRLVNNSRIGVNVTEIIQDSATSAFLVEGGALLASPFAGNVTVLQGTLQLNQSGYIAESATVTVDSGAVLNLNFTGTKVVGALFLGGQAKSIGIYNSANSDGRIAGNGALQVLVSPTIPTVLLLK